MSRQQESVYAPPEVIVIDDDDDADDSDEGIDEGYGLSDFDLQRSEQALIRSSSLDNSVNIRTTNVRMVARRSVPFTEQEQSQASSSDSQQRLPMITVPLNPSVQPQPPPTFSLPNTLHHSVRTTSSSSRNVVQNSVNRESQRNIDPRSMDTIQSPVVASSSLSLDRQRPTRTSSHNSSSNSTTPQSRVTSGQVAGKTLPSKDPRKSNQTTKKRKRTKWLKEIRKYQKSTELLIPRLPFQRLVREIGLKVASERGFGLLWKPDAFAYLHHASEDALVDLLRDANLCAIHAKRQTLKAKDMHLVLKLRPLVNSANRIDEACAKEVANEQLNQSFQDDPNDGDYQEEDMENSEDESVLDDEE
ncbi:hypothetical protein C9374_008699 [Naegleria lovaniensis]|uniref:Core Histone H2A/H2B/H3 domain-containing protein n=1 Tax=Naegleria lovaniensis TaxID=51637 RepID=A0AA88GIP4_NAELO|nr:uncharacterized protein C9374_008699 [Naegleria lovaniensis]KAG2378077.1 hypothetical protein C9374_008699 [Naegleria lovaniensis]